MSLDRALAALMNVAVLALLTAVVAANAEPAQSSALRGYTFRLGSGMTVAPIGSQVRALMQRLDGHEELTSIHFGSCTELRYSVSAAANRNKKPDLLAVYCKPSDDVVEIHLRSNAFCTTSNICIGTPESLKRLVAAMGTTARLSRGECLSGGGGCSIVTRADRHVVTELRSANCRTFASLRIPTRCVAAEVLVYETHALTQVPRRG